MPRAIWKGAISFGLVHVPVALYPASQDDDIDFDWLDKRSMDPVGYKRINKRTGREIDKDDIVRGVKHGDGEYVVLGNEEIAAAYPRRTQSIEIESFVEAQDISFVFLERPYFVEPVGHAEKVYTLLREAMLKASVIGIARMVLHTKEHLTALIATDTALMLNTLRWSSEIRSPDELSIPGSGTSAPKLKDGELKMAVQLIDNMKSKWAPQDHADTFTEAIHKLVERKVKAGKTQTVEPFETPPEGPTDSNVVDLTELLKRSLGTRKSGQHDTPAKATHKRVTAKRAASRKRA